MAASSPPAGQDELHSGRFIRHQLTDRLFHWITAAAIVTLLATAFLPIYGYRFDWVPIHWTTGLVLTALVLFHIVRASIWQGLAAILPGPRDVSDGWRIFRRTVVDRSAPPIKQGKYSLAQKLLHLAITAIILATIVTGLLMLAKIDTSYWQRNPYFLSSYNWGIVYVLHGYASMALITLIIIHIYFALRPEKLFFLRSMIVGWITGKEYRKTFDAGRWKAEEVGSAATSGSEPTGGPAQL